MNTPITGDRMMASLGASFERLQNDSNMLVSETCLGELAEGDGKVTSQTLYLAYLKVYRFDQGLLQDNPETGGLLINK